MPTFRSGNGGYVQISEDGQAWYTLIVAVWELNDDSRKTENTHSGTGGASNYEHVVGDANWRLQIPWDEANTPESYGLTKGAKVYLRFKHGSGSITKQISETLVEHVKTVNDNSQDIVRAEIDGCGGTVT